MNFFKPIYIAPNIHQLRAIGARVTVVKGSEGVALVDTGGPGSTGAITSGLKALGLSLAQVRWIVLTHYHPDHSGSLGRLAQKTGAQVAMHTKEWPLLSPGGVTPSPFNNHVLARLTEPVVQQLYDPPAKVDRLLENGDELSLGGSEKLVVVHTPGHTPGSISLLAMPQRVLIVGDALMYRSRKLGPPAPGVTQDATLAMDSVHKMIALDIEMLCFSHFPHMRSGAKEALRRRFGSPDILSSTNKTD
ncbi:MAG: MBL fold metallo-hydrolase [Chloroflexi bacterium]|nr:MBL fold metallo-hydrolase [Chloroflexota bacterium]